MKSKITLVRSSAARTSGISVRCQKKNAKGVRCRNKALHAGHCSFTESPSKRSQKEKPKKKIHVSRETKLSCLEMIEDPIYRQQLLRDLRARNLRPAVEVMLWYYAKGKPKELVEHSGTLSLQQELSTLTDEQLRTRALDIASMLKSPSVH